MKLVKKIISVSRRTDIPAFYGDWFIRRLNAGFAGWENPFGGQRIITSLKPEDVRAFVFWSKNYGPFLKHLAAIRERDIPAMFNFTITGMPLQFECNLVAPDEAVTSLRELSALFSPDHITWRYDPIVISCITDEAYHVTRFRQLVEQLAGHVTRCCFSFAARYGKVERSFKRFERETGITVTDPEKGQRLELARKITDIAEESGISMHSCCGDYLLADPRIRKAHCIDGELLEQLYPSCGRAGARGTREECGCSESTDIGRYDTCPHGCIYCYATTNKERAEKLHAGHDPEAVFLGCSRQQSDAFLQEIVEGRRQAVATSCQPALFC